MSFNLARPAGIEPTTPWFVAKYSIQLSYGRAEESIAELAPLGQPSPSGNDQLRRGALPRVEVLPCLVDLLP